jgi:glyceraldehyde 3-phosphate dehydrogenase
MARIGINGFGRIGRQAFKSMLERYPEELAVVAINDLTDLTTLAHLLRYDSTYGEFDGSVTVQNGRLEIDYVDDAGEERHYEIAALAERDPGRIPWGDYDVDIVIEATGRFTDAERARAHLRSGAAKVIITAPANGEDLTICLGVNEDRYDSAIHHVISNASCTTNCLAPVAKVLNDTFGIRYGLMTTIHSYTMDQNLQDNVHSDLRRARAAALNMAPTSTGAARAVALVIPELRGKFDGLAVRVPTPTVSLIDFVVELENVATVDEVNDAFRDAAESDELEGILEVSEEPLVSTDFIASTASAIVDLPLTLALGGNFIKVIAWYDNEWGYATRVADLAAFVADEL